MPRITVITPCYNDGRFLEEAIKSLSSEQYPGLFEQIIVDDGSTDPETRRVLSECESRGIKIYYQPNGGAASARNVAIIAANSSYILPLDCDNKIDPEVFIEALEFMDQHPEVDVVHTYAQYFGEKEGLWSVEPFNLLKLIQKNYIDTCALIRKSALLDVGMYDEHSQFRGFDDWRLWIKMGIARKGFHLLPRIGFYYRYRKDSLSLTKVKSRYFSCVEEVYKNYGQKTLSVLKEDGYKISDILGPEIYFQWFTYWRSLLCKMNIVRFMKSICRFSRAFQLSFLLLLLRFFRFLIVLTPYWRVKRLF